MKNTLVGAHGFKVVESREIITDNVKAQMTGGGSLHIIKGDASELLRLFPSVCDVHVPDGHDEAKKHLEDARKSIFAARESILLGWKNP